MIEPIAATNCNKNRESVIRWRRCWLSALPLAFIAVVAGCLLPMSEHAFLVVKATTELGSFHYAHVAADSSGKLYFGNASDWDTDTNYDLYVFSQESGGHPVDSFHGSIEHIVYDAASNAMFLSEGMNIWRLDVDTDTAAIVYTDSQYRLFNLQVAGEYIIAHASAFSDGTLPKPRLIRMSDYTVTHTGWLDGWAPYYYAYAPSLNKRFILAGDDIGYQTVDLVGETLGLHIETRQVSGWGGPIQLFPDESMLILSTGEVLATDNNLTQIGSLDETFEDLRFHGDRMFLLRDSWEAYELIQLSDDTWERIGEPFVFEGAFSGDLLIGGDYLHVIANLSGSLTCRAARFDLQNL